MKNLPNVRMSKPLDLLQWVLLDFEKAPIVENNLYFGKMRLFDYFSYTVLELIGEIEYFELCIVRDIKLCSFSLNLLNKKLNQKSLMWKQSIFEICISMFAR